MQIVEPAAAPLDPLVTAAERRLAALVAGARLRHVLVLVGSLTLPYRGVKLIAVDLVRVLRRAGAEVTLGTFRTDAGFLAMIPDIEDMVVFEDDLRPMMDRTFDLVLTHGWHTANLVLLECRVAFRRLILGSFSSFTPGEVIFGLDVLADALMFESTHNQEAQEPSLRHSPAAKFALRNALPREWFAGHASPDAAAPRRIAVVTNHRCAEVEAVIPRLREAGFEVDVFGRHGEVRLVDPAAIDACDLLITIGATVQKALVRGVPAFCYDHFGGPGYVTQGKLERAEHYNFSGRCTFDRREPDALFREILDGYAAVRADIATLRTAARARYCMEERLGAIIAAFPEREAPRSFRGPEYSNLRKIYHLHANAIYPTPIFSFGYMVRAGEQPVLRMVRLAPATTDPVVEVAVPQVSPFLFLADQEVTFRLRLLVKLRGEHELRRLVLREGGTTSPVPDVQVQYRPRFGITELRAQIAHPITAATAAFRVLAQLEGGPNLEVLRVRLLR